MPWKETHKMNQRTEFVMKALQTECAEVLVRRYELWPLGKFEEKWADADKK
jgi:hypothetical protein